MSITERNHRLGRVVRCMHDAGVTTLIAPSWAGHGWRTYLTGSRLDVSGGHVVVRADGIVEVIAGPATMLPSDLGWAVLREGPTDLASLVRELGGTTIGTVGPDDAARAADGAVDLTPELLMLRAIKSDEELLEIEASAYLVDRVTERLLEWATPGSTPRQIGTALRARAFELGATDAVVVAHRMIGDPDHRRISADPHDDRELRAGEPVQFGIAVAGPTGYWSATARPIGFAPTSDDDQTAARSAGAAVATMQRGLRAGAHTSDAIDVARQIAAEEGGALTAASITGIGLARVEWPDASAGFEAVEGMTLHVTAIARAGAALAVQADTIVVEREASRLLSSFPIGVLHPDYWRRASTRG
jgi:Xaa-Pro aminopeptidase